MEDRRDWTLAYRNPRANRFIRVPLQLTWAQAMYAAGQFARVRPDLEVWYTTTRECEARTVADAARGDRHARALLDDIGNILVDSARVKSGKRVRITREDGELDPRVCVLPAHVADAAYRSRAYRWRV